jgi:integrase
MESLPVIVETDPPLVISESTRRYAEESRSKATRDAYAADLRAFRNWGGQIPATPAEVADFLSWCADAGYAAATIQRRVSAISQAHQALGVDNPTRSEGVRRTHRGIRRTLGAATVKKSAITSSDLRSYFASINGDLRAIRDRSILTMGLAGAFRRSELAALEVEDLEETTEGYRVTVRRSKTDQEGRGQVKVIVYGRDQATCPVLLLRTWLKGAGIESGPLYRPINRGGRVGPDGLTGRSVAEVVKRAARALGKDPSSFSGHSLRRGFITEASHAGAQIQEIMEQTGHSSFQTVRRYIEYSKTSKGNAVTALDL